MRYIKKGAAPRELKVWFDGQVIGGKRMNSHFTNLDPQVKDLIGQYLLVEQGWLCGYTGMSLTEDDYHIEHLLPQSISRARDTYEDVDYRNMLAAYPKGPCSYGAQARGDRPLPIDPFQPVCATKFDFDSDG